MPRPEALRPPINVPEGTDPARISLRCASGQHDQCAGEVYAFAGHPATPTILCECPMPGCPHGQRERRRPTR